MTLPASFPMSMSQIATELGLSLPLSISHAWVIALAGKSALPVSFSDLLGKTGHFSGGLVGAGAGSVLSVSFANAPFFGGSLGSCSQQSTAITLTFSAAPNWSGNIALANTTVSASTVLSKSNATTWTGFGNLLPSNGVTNNITVYPSN